MICLEQIAKHSHDLANNIIKNQCLPAIFQYINKTENETRLRGILTLINISFHDSSLAKTLIEEKCLPVIKNVLIKDKNLLVQSACCQCLYEIAKHGNDFVNPIIDENFSMLLILIKQGKGEELQKAEAILKKLIEFSLNIDFLQDIFLNGPRSLYSPVLIQISRVIQSNSKAKKYSK